MRGDGWSDVRVPPPGGADAHKTGASSPGGVGGAQPRKMVDQNLLDQNSKSGLNIGLRSVAVIAVQQGTASNRLDVLPEVAESPGNAQGSSFSMMLKDISDLSDVDLVIAPTLLV